MSKRSVQLTCRTSAGVNYEPLPWLVQVAKFPDTLSLRIIDTIVLESKTVSVAVFCIRLVHQLQKDETSEFLTDALMVEPPVFPLTGILASI
jgi:hypothetical protein